MNYLPIAGYCDKLSARPGEKIRFYVSSQSKAEYSARLCRSICADPNPSGPGIIEEDASQYFAQSNFPSRFQDINIGSYAETEAELIPSIKSNTTVKFWFMPTHISAGDQAIFSWGNLSVLLQSNGHLSVAINGKSPLASKAPLRMRRWYRFELNISPNGAVSFDLETPSNNGDQVESTTGQIEHEDLAKLFASGAAIRLAAGFAKDKMCFNGRIEAPQILENETTIAEWDFSKDISSLTAKAVMGPDLILKNAPTRGVTGRQWDASEFSWKHKPDHYAAIHFHDDDVYDFHWDCDFEFVVPDDMPSGVYVMRIHADSNEDAIPFFICPALNRPKSDICVLVSTFTYTVYGNHARPDFSPSYLTRMKEWDAYPYNPAQYPHYGLSTYNTHTDGSGICHASHKRVLFNLRPGYITFGDAECSGLRHFQADSHLLAWLHHQNIEYDIITDDELDRDGVEALSSYKMVLTGSHPEYHTSQMLDALKQYRDGGGGLIYLGGNGFYWRIARHGEDPSLIEIRRSEDGLRAWAAEPGEYYNAFDGSYGGLWRRNGRPPQQLVGIGFTAQANFVGMPYKRVCHDPAFDWVFKGIETDTFGDFGLSGNGAAGFELDRCDEKLDEGEDITILAQSFDKDGQFILVPEEILTHLTNLSGGPEEQVKRADMVYFKTASGGQVFSVGSITFCGSLPWNNFDNNVSTLLRNVITKFRGE